MQAMGMGVGGIAALLTWAFSGDLWHIVVAAVVGMVIGMILGYLITRWST